MRMIAATAAAAAKRNDMIYPPLIANLKLGSPADAEVGTSGSRLCHQQTVLITLEAARRAAPTQCRGIFLKFRRLPLVPVAPSEPLAPRPRSFGSNRSPLNCSRNKSACAGSAKLKKLYT